MRGSEDGGGVGVGSGVKGEKEPVNTGQPNHKVKEKGQAVWRENKGEGGRTE